MMSIGVKLMPKDDTENRWVYSANKRSLKPLVKSLVSRILNVEQIF